MIDQIALMLEQDIVHLPEFLLRPRCLRCLRGDACVGMNRGLREMPEDKPQAVGELALQLVDAVA